MELRKYILDVSILSLLMCFLGSCKKLVAVDVPVSSLVSGSVFTSDQSAIATTTAMYATMSSGSFATGNTSVSFYSGLSADEISLWSGTTNTTFLNYYRNSLSSTINGSEFWAPCYNYIFRCNSIIEGLNSDAANALTPFVRRQLLGEAKFIRAFVYFYLVNLFGDLPLVTTSDYKINALLARSEKTKVYQQIISDLIDAQNMLSTSYLTGYLQPYAISSIPEKVRPTKWAATALLSRVYLYSGDYVNAEQQATQIINNSSMFRLVPLNSVFLKNSDEAIWQLQPVVGTQVNTLDGYYFIIPSTGFSQTFCFYLNPSLVNSFETNDNRKTAWTRPYTSGTNTFYYPYKYQSNLVSATTVPPVEYLMVLRLAEQYLIRAEARGQQSNIGAAVADIDSIRKRANLPFLTLNDKASVLLAITHERQVELFTEWGHRWLDIKRNNTVDSIMNVQTSLKGAVWSTYQKLYPISSSDIIADPNLVQNPSY